MQTITEPEPQEKWAPAQWQDTGFLFPLGWTQKPTDTKQLAFTPINSADSGKVWITLRTLPNEDFGLRGTLERFIRQNIGDAKNISLNSVRKVQLGSGYNGLMQRVTILNDYHDPVYNWYFIVEVRGQNKMLCFTVESTERQTQYQKDFNRFLNNLTFD